MNPCTDLGPHLVKWNLFINVRAKARARVLASAYNLKEETIVEIAIDYLKTHDHLIQEYVLKEKQK